MPTTSKGYRIDCCGKTRAMRDPDQDRKDTLELLRAGGEVGGAMSGAAVGLIVGGPVSGVAGALVGSLVKVGADFWHRQLSMRQRSRVVTALRAADERLWHRIMAGEEVRDDDFFIERPDGNSSADEVVDAVLSAVRDESEERKAPYRPVRNSRTRTGAKRRISRGRRLGSRGRAAPCGGRRGRVAGRCSGRGR